MAFSSYCFVWAQRSIYECAFAHVSWLDLSNFCAGLGGMDKCQCKANNIESYGCHSFHAYYQMKYDDAIKETKLRAGQQSLSHDPNHYPILPSAGETEDCHHGRRDISL